jgi:hypothetical protein
MLAEQHRTRLFWCCHASTKNQPALAGTSRSPGSLWVQAQTGTQLVAVQLTGYIRWGQIALFVHTPAGPFTNPDWAAACCVIGAS